MKLGYILVYVPHVPDAIKFYQHAFGLKVQFIHESNQYATLETGTTVLGFVSETLAKQSGIDYNPNRIANPAAGCEIAFVTKDVEKAYKKALNEGAHAVSAPAHKPWGQIVAYVRDLNGFLIELCSPMGE